MHLLPFQSAILNELRQDDSLIVLARGLGVEQLLYHLIRVECAQSNKLVIVLNLSEEQRRFINDALLNDAYSRDRGSAASSSGAAASPDASPQTPERSPSYSPSESPSPPALPSNAHSFRPLRQLTSEFTSAERHLAYIEGGCIAVTNRIFVVDLLTKNINVDLLDGIIVNNAHQVNDMTIEAFILRIYCQQQVKHGWIKAFSDNPTRLTGGLFKMNTLIKSLYVHKLSLWPRFHLAISNTLESPQTIQPEVIQLNLVLTDSMAMIQNSLIEVMDTCISQLKKDGTAKHGVSNVMNNISNITIELALTKSFDTLIRNELQPSWNRVSTRSKQLIADLQLMRKLLSYLINYDGVTFYRYLMTVRQQCSQSMHSVWLFTEAAERLFKIAKQRVYIFVDQDDALKLKQRNGKTGSKSTKSSKQKTSKQSTLNGQVLDPEDPLAEPADKPDPALHLVLEENPKWQLLADILDEVDREQRKIKQQARTLILCRDEAVCMFIRRYLEIGGHNLLAKNWRRYLFGLRLHKRNIVLPTADSEIKLTAAQQETVLLQRLVQQMIAEAISARNEAEIKATEQLAAGGRVGKQQTSPRNKSTKRKQPANTKGTDHKATGKKPKGKQTAARPNAEKPYQSVEDDDIVVVPDELGADGVRSEEGMDDEGDRDAARALQVDLDEGRDTMTVNADGGYSNAPSIIDATFTLASQPTAMTLQATNGNTDATVAAPVFEDTLHLEETKVGDIIQPVSASPIVIHPHHGANLLLYQYKPTHIVLFDPELDMLRQIEVYQAQLASTGQRIKLYFTIYDNSAEDQRYRTSINQEKSAFEKLIQDKGQMVIQIDERHQHLRNPGMDQLKDASQLKTVEIMGRDLDDFRAPTSNAYAALLPSAPKAVATRQGGMQYNVQDRVLVDMREFRSSLPSLLHARGMEIVPVTMELGDYLLTPHIIVERKSLSDLIGSFASGRLYRQMEHLLRFYKNPILLIEFDRNKTFSLVQRSELDMEISPRSNISKLVLLCLHFPTMRIVWSRDAVATASLFAVLKRNSVQPELSHAITSGIAQEATVSESTAELADIMSALPGNGLDLDDDGANRAAQAGDGDEERAAALTPSDILRRMPGVNALNMRKIMENVESLSQLATVSLPQLTDWMASAVNARRLYTFMHSDVAKSFL